MTNVATALKEEITRLARKEIKAETEALKKASSAYRSEIADLKRRAASLEKQLAKLGKEVSRATPPPKEIYPEKIRFVAKGFKSLREKLGVTAGEIAGLLDVSPAVVYNWEGGVSKPKQPQLIKIAHLRKMGKKDVAEVLAQLTVPAPAPKSRAKVVKLAVTVAKPKKVLKSVKATAKTSTKAAIASKKVAQEIKGATKPVSKPRLPNVKQEPAKIINLPPA
jgi:DNA-binding transcriptional regulator YiaG